MASANLYHNKVAHKDTFVNRLWICFCSPYNTDCLVVCNKCNQTIIENNLHEIMCCSKYEFDIIDMLYHFHVIAYYKNMIWMVFYNKVVLHHTKIWINKAHHLSLTHVNDLAIIGWQVEKMAWNTCCDMTSH